MIRAQKVDKMEANSIYSQKLLKGKKAFVTGGATGLGKAIASGLSAVGAEVTIVSRNKEKLLSSATEISTKTGNEVFYDVVDIRDVDSVKQLSDRHERVDILVNNAGGQFPQKARDFSVNGWRSVIDLNLNGTWNMTQIFGNKMLDSQGGSICQIVATVGRGIPGIAHSATARAGVLELSRTLAFEWGPKVRVN